MSDKCVLLNKKILFAILLQNVRHRNVTESSETKIFRISRALQNSDVCIGGKMLVRYKHFSIRESICVEKKTN